MKGFAIALEDNGFVDIQVDDVSEQYASHYRQAMVRIEEARDWITERYSARVYNIVVKKNGYASLALDKGPGPEVQSLVEGSFDAVSGQIEYGEVDLSG